MRNQCQRTTLCSIHRGSETRRRTVPPLRTHYNRISRPNFRAAAGAPPMLTTTLERALAGPVTGGLQSGAGTASRRHCTAAVDGRQVRRRASLQPPNISPPMSTDGSPGIRPVPTATPWPCHARREGLMCVIRKDQRLDKGLVPIVGWLSRFVQKCTISIFASLTGTRLACPWDISCGMSGSPSRTPVSCGFFHRAFTDSGVYRAYRQCR